MKIFIPVLEENGLNSQISAHFGRTPILAIIDEENKEIKDLSFKNITGKHAGGHETLGQILLGSEADLLIAGNMGPKAVQMLENSNIKVLTGADGTVNDTFNLWKNGNLDIAKEDNCANHRNHGC